MAIPSLRDVARLTTDAIYVTVGFGVLAADRLRGRRRELGQRLGLDIPDLRERLQAQDRSPAT